MRWSRSPEGGCERTAFTDPVSSCTNAGTRLDVRLRTLIFLQSVVRSPLSPSLSMAAIKRQRLPCGVRNGHRVDFLFPLLSRSRTFPCASGTRCFLPFFLCIGQVDVLFTTSGDNGLECGKVAPCRWGRGRGWVRRPTTPPRC